MTFEDNYIHADLHSGNIIVRGLPQSHEHAEAQNKARPLSLIDTGLVAKLSGETGGTSSTSSVLWCATVAQRRAI